MCIKNKILAIVVVSLFACKTGSEREIQKLQSDMMTYFKVNIMDSTLTLDSFRLIKIDTISQRILLNEQLSELGRQLDYLVDLYKMSTQELSISVDQMRLYRMLDSKELVEMEKKDFDKKEKEGRLIKFEIDTLMSIIKAIDSSIYIADTTKAVGFQAKCFYQLRRKDKSVERDTTFILLNTNKDIVKRTDFLKLPYNVDFNKFR